MQEGASSCFAIIRVHAVKRLPERIPSPLHGMDQVPVAVGLAVRVQPVLQELLLCAVLQAEQVVHVLLHGLVGEPGFARPVLAPGPQELFGLLFRQNRGGPWVMGITGFGISLAGFKAPTWMTPGCVTSSKSCSSSSEGVGTLSRRSLGCRPRPWKPGKGLLRAAARGRRAPRAWTPKPRLRPARGRARARAGPGEGVGGARRAGPAGSRAGPGAAGWSAAGRAAGGGGRAGRGIT